MEPPGTKFCLGSLGHMTKMTTTPIYDKNLLASKGPVTLVLVMQHLGLGPNKVFPNNDLGFTLSFFMARSNFIPYSGKIYISA